MANRVTNIDRFVPLLGVGVCWLLTVGNVQAQALQTTALFNNTDLTGWEKVGTNAIAHDAVLTVVAGNGWLRTGRRYSDFTLHFDARVTGERAQAAVYVRAYRNARGDSQPDTGLELEIGGDSTVVRVRDIRRGTSLPVSAKESPGSDGWHHYDVECRQPVLTVTIDGVRVVRMTDIMNPSGFIGFGARRGALDVRQIELESRKIPGVERPQDIVEEVNGALPPDVTKPIVQQRVEPTYSLLAQAARIEGVVVVEAVVGTDGKAYDVVVTEPVDSLAGLDASAVASVQQMTYTPATRNGRPVPARIKVKFTFVLR